METSEKNNEPLDEYCTVTERYKDPIVTLTY